MAGCTATKFANVAIKNEKPEYGGQSLFVIQCENGHIVAPNEMAILEAILRHQTSILVKILETLEIKG